MRTSVVPALLLLLIVGITSCSSSALSKNKAKEQIEQQRNGPDEACKIILYKGIMLNHGNRLQEENRHALVNKGKKYVVVYLNVIYDVISKLYEVEHLELAEASKPFVSVSDGKTIFTTGKVSIEILSITEPAPADGALVCKVRYKEVFEPNDLGKDIGFRSCKRPEEEKTATFVKMQDGWQLQKDQYLWE